MDLIVEDGSNVANANTYISLEDANAYFDARLNSTTWTTATDAAKKQALATATKTLDSSFDWLGYRANDVQALEWPRTQVIDTAHVPLGANVPWAYGAGSFGSPPFTSIGTRYIPTTVIPPRLKDAVCEQTIEMMKRDRTAEWGAIGISNVGLGRGALSVTFSDSASAEAQLIVIPSRVADMLVEFGTPNANRVAGRVHRG